MNPFDKNNKFYIIIGFINEVVFWIKLFEHVGIYDFLGIFWAGIINLTIFMIAYGITTSSIGNMLSDINNNIGAFLIIYVISGYFLGSLLHEIGRTLRDRLNIFGEDAIGYYLNSADINIHMKKGFISIIKQEITNTTIDFDKLGSQECKFLYDYCNVYLKKYNLNLRSDRTQSIYGLSRGFFTGQALFSIIYVVILLYYNVFTLQTTMMLAITTLSAIVFFIRTKIYDKNRVKNIIAMYYVDRSTRC